MMYENKTLIDMEKTGFKLRSYADRHGYSAKDIQQYLGLSCPQPVYRWFKGLILPSVDNLLKLSELFHVHMEELLVKSNLTLINGHSKDMRAYRVLLFERMHVYYNLTKGVNQGIIGNDRD